MSTVAKVLGIRLPNVAGSRLQVSVCSNPELVVGMELEIENVGDFDHAFSRVNQNIWGMTEDGSLRPQRLSWEYISKPMRLENMIPELEFFFTNNRFDERNYSDRTSVHVHTNVTDFTQAQLATLALTYTVFEDVLFQFINNFNRVEEQGFCRDTNIYCIPWTQCRMNAEFVKLLFADTNKAVRGWQKYTALNLLPVREHGTVEWRHMHGTNDLVKLKKWLNIIGSIMAFAKKTDFDNMEKNLLTLNDTSMYQQFFQAVLGDLLPFDDAYARCMSEGVTNAKFALMNRNSKGKKEETDDLPEALPNDPFLVQVEEAVRIAARQVAERPLLDDAAARNRIQQRAAAPARPAARPVGAIPQLRANWVVADDIFQG